MILSCSNTSKPLGKRHILKQVSLHLEDHEKAAVVGIDGAGKFTLLKIIIGEPASDEGCVALGREASIGYLTQHQNLNSESTIHDALLEVKWSILQMEKCIRTLELDMKSASGESLEAMLEEYSCLTHQFGLEGGYACRSETAGVLKGLGFAEEEFPKPINALSDGQKTRVFLGKLLLTKPDVLLLDEPTNRLDMGLIAWLEIYLKTYSGGVITIAHDRCFLDQVMTKIVELNNGTGIVFGDSYTAYNNKKAMFHGARIQACLSQQQRIRHQEAVIAKLRSFNREKSIRRAENREKMLEKVDRLEKPMDINDSMDTRLEPDMEGGKDVLTVIGLSKSFDSQTSFTDVSFEIRREERMAIIDNNGTGKTIPLKTINQLPPADVSKICLGSEVHIGYYDQEYQVLHMDKTLSDEIQDTYPNMNNARIRDTLASSLFTGDDVSKLIHDLSGDERGRVSLAKLMFPDANFLLLGELANHLDIISKEVPENALCRYTGIVLYVSHGRHFTSYTTIRILDLTGQSPTNYIGSYDYYLERKDAVKATPAVRNRRTSSAPNLSQASGRPSQGSQNDLKLERKVQKEEQARVRRTQDEFKKTEDSIRALKTKDNKIDTLLTQEEVYTDVSRPIELNKEKEEIAGQPEELYRS